MLHSESTRSRKSIGKIIYDVMVNGGSSFYTTLSITYDILFNSPDDVMHKMIEHTFLKRPAFKHTNFVLVTEDGIYIYPKPHKK